MADNSTVGQFIEIESVSALPTAGRRGRIVYLTTGNVGLYRDNGTTFHQITDANTTTGLPTHASTHGSAGSDAVTPAGIGASATGHGHVAGDVTGTAVLTADSRLSDARTPLAHAHAAADVTGTAVVTADARLSDARTPTAHAASHKSAGGDAIKLDELAAPTDVTTLDATTVQHGLLPKLGGGTSNFFRADGTWQPPSSSDLALSKLAPAANVTITAGYSAYVSPYYEYVNGITTEIGAGSTLEIG